MKRNKIIQYKSLKINAALNIIKQIFSIIFPMITFPYAARTLGVDAYGKYIFSLSIINYLSYIAAAGILRYAVRECAKVRENENKVRELVSEIFTINVLTTLLAFSTLFFLILILPGLQPYIPYILVISLSVLFTTLGVDWINSAYEDYLFITIRYIFSQSIAFVLLFIFVHTSEDLLYYSFISVIGGIIANLWNIFHIRNRLGFYPKISFKSSLIKHVKPILYLFATTIATFIYVSSDVTILRIFFDDKIIAYYGISIQFYQVIKQLIVAAFIVIIPRISNELTKCKDSTINKYNNILAITLLLIIPCSVGLFMIRENIIILFAGHEYLKSSSSLAILSFSLIPSMLANFYINIVMIPMHMEKRVMIATMFSALVNIILNFMLIPIYAENAAALTTLIAESLLVIFAIYYCRGQKITMSSKGLIVSIVASLAIFTVCYYLKTKIVLSVINNVILSIILSVLIYLFILTLAYKPELNQAINKIKLRNLN